MKRLIQFLIVVVITITISEAQPVSMGKTMEIENESMTIFDKTFLKGKISIDTIFILNFQEDIKDSQIKKFWSQKSEKVGVINRHNVSLFEVGEDYFITVHASAGNYEHARIAAQLLFNRWAIRLAEEMNLYYSALNNTVLPDRCDITVICYDEMEVKKGDIEIAIMCFDIKAIKINGEALKITKNER